jgi:hypothetical protein
MGSSALSMKSALLGVQPAGDSLENEECCTGWRPWIIEIAGEPRYRLPFSFRPAPQLKITGAIFDRQTPERGQRDRVMDHLRPMHADPSMIIEGRGRWRSRRDTSDDEFN